MYFPKLLLLTAPLASAQLNKLAQKAGKHYFGTATDSPELNNTQYVKILSNTDEFGQITPSNGMKWEFVEPEQNVYNYTLGEIISKLAHKNGQILRCHNLVWHSQLADWAADWNGTRQGLIEALEAHIAHEAGHWKGQCYAWDVVNEALNDDGTYRNDTFLSVIGPEYIRIAFAAAAKADPHAKLYYNDYNIENVGVKSNSTRENIVKYLQDAHIRIDGVGLQGHFIVGETPALADQISNLELFGDMGLETAYTEVDIRLYEPENSTNLAQQAVDYGTTVQACLSVKSCIGMTVWDFYDPFSWVPGVFTGQGSADLWFANFTKHPAYYTIVDKLKDYKQFLSH